MSREHANVAGTVANKLGRKDTVVHENLSIPFKNDGDRFTLKVPRAHMTLTCKAVGFVMTNDIDENGIDDILKDAYFELEIGDKTVIKNKLSFYKELHPVKVLKNRFIVTLPVDYLINEIYLSNLRFHEVILHIGSIGNAEMIKQINFYGSFRNYCPPLEVRNPREVFIQNVQSKYLQLEEPTNAVGISLPSFVDLCRGYFIEAPIDNITNLKLKLNGCVRMDYDDIMINKFCKKVSEKLLYVPFDDNFNYMETDEAKLRESFKYGIPQDRIDQIKVELTLSEPTTHVAVHSLNCNKFRYEHGLGAVVDLVENGYKDGTGYETVCKNEYK